MAREMGPSGAPLVDLLEAAERRARVRAPLFVCWARLVRHIELPFYALLALTFGAGYPLGFYKVLIT